MKIERRPRLVRRRRYWSAEGCPAYWVITTELARKPILRKVSIRRRTFSVVGKAGNPADFIFSMEGADDQYDFRLILQLLEHFEFAVRFKAGKDAGSMVIVKSFRQTPDALSPNMAIRSLMCSDCIFQIFVIIKSVLHSSLFVFYFWFCVQFLQLLIPFPARIPCRLLQIHILLP